MQANKNTTEFIEGLDYPIAKAQVVSAAGDAGLGATIEESLGKLPDREYADAEDLTKALSAS